MWRIKHHQRGGSAISTAITLAVVAYLLFVGIQYVPQLIESGSIDSILESLEKNQQTDPAKSAGAVQGRINSLLDTNMMNDKRDVFSVRQNGNTVIVDVSYDRELNLLFDTRTMPYRKTITLEFPAY